MSADEVRRELEHLMSQLNEERARVGLAKSQVLTAHRKTDSILGDAKGEGSVASLRRSVKDFNRAVDQVDEAHDALKAAYDALHRYKTDRFGSGGNSGGSVSPPGAANPGPSEAGGRREPVGGAENNTGGNKYADFAGKTVKAFFSPEIQREVIPSAAGEIIGLLTDDATGNAVETTIGAVWDAISLGALPYTGATIAALVRGKRSRQQKDNNDE